ncbi:hypothetical protein [Flavobacterium sp. N502540]|uniref:hypothetical protein n=1 Tax=Flavobacterium sp. N502540 TaxID=2986838 RepID=UPI0022256477|nr:hypothetical protein [Flavobacterium sp. N502540]
MIILPLFFFHNAFGQTKTTTHTIEFTGSGILTSPPPQIVKDDEKLAFKINCSQDYLQKRIKDAIEVYLVAMGNIQNSKTYQIIDEDNTQIFKVRCAMGKEITSVLDYLSDGDKAIIEERLIFLDYDQTCKTDDMLKSLKDTTIVPPLKNLILPAFSLDIRYYDKLGHELKPETLNFKASLDSLNKSLKINIIETTMANGYETVKFELREKNSINAKIQEQLKRPEINYQQSELKKALKIIKDKMNPQFIADLARLKVRADHGALFFKDPTANPVDNQWILASNKSLGDLNQMAEDMLNELRSENIKSWFLDWMWLTKGLPTTNPFDYQAQPLIAGSSNAEPAKVTEKEKALVETFDAMVAKEAFKLTSLSGSLDKDLEVISGIKARLKAESKAIPATNSSDTYWYSGIVKITGEKQNNYMISHDAAENYLLMTDPLKEVTEKDQVSIFTQNKKEGDPTKIQVIPTAITSDDGQITEEIEPTFSFNDQGTAPQNPELLLFLKNYQLFEKKIEFLQSLKVEPKLPVLFAKSASPIYKTENLNYNTVFDAPQRLDYTLSTGTKDAPVEVFKGNFRVNKLYNVRFKAGMVFSNLKIKDYTKNSDNSFSLTEDRAGIDGTFGVQIFFCKTDIRDINVWKGKVSPFLYTGFSMKDITESFYPGVGLEIFSGVSVAYILHVGRSEVLTGSGNVPSQIEHKWVAGSGISILVDGAFFVNLFKFGSNKSLFEL